VLPRTAVTVRVRPSPLLGNLPLTKHTAFSDKVCSSKPPLRNQTAVDRGQCPPRSTCEGLVLISQHRGAPSRPEVPLSPTLCSYNTRDVVVRYIYTVVIINTQVLDVHLLFVSHMTNAGLP